jgi:magnesium transporter
MSFTLFIFVYCEVFVISYFRKIKNYSPCWVAFVVGLALFLQVVVSMILGALLPLIVKLLNKDPAVVASPAITTIVDVTGILIYFSIASLLL